MKKKVKIGLGIVVAIIFYFFTKFLSNDIFFGDDTTSIINWLSEGGKFNFDGILTGLFVKLTTKDLPLLLNINPHAFSMTFGAYVRAFNIVLLCIAMSIFMYNGREKTKTFPIFVTFSAFYFCYACTNIELFWFNPNQIPTSDIAGSFILLTEYSQHFGQLFSFILGLFAIYFIINYFTNNKIPNEKNLVLISIIAFITATLSMFVNIITGVLLLCISLYLVILNYKKDKKIIFNKVIYLPLISYFLGSIVFSFYPGFFKYFSTNVDIVSFTKILFENFVMTNSFEFALIIILSAILYLLALHKTTYIKRTIFSVFSILMGIFIYFTMFSSLDKNIAILMTESQVLLRLLLMSLIFLLFGSCLKEHTSEPKELKILSISFSLILTAFMLVQIPIIRTTMKLWNTMNEETKVTVYCLEKMYRFYSLRGKTALLPEDSLYKIFKVSYFINDKNIDIDEQITNRTFLKHTDFTDSYYKTFYKDSKIVAYKFINAQIALKIFFEEGGMIDEKEIKTLNFQNLYNDKFVLNRAIEKSKYDENK